MPQTLEKHTDCGAVTAVCGGGMEVVTAKLHGLQVTESRLDYHGSITIDQKIIRSAGLVPLEFVNVWNKATGARLSTYLLPGPEGAGTCSLNGAAARRFRAGDEIIVTAKRLAPGLADVLSWPRPRVLTFVHAPRVNAIDEILLYDLTADEAGGLVFEIRRVHP